MHHFSFVWHKWWLCAFPSLTLLMKIFITFFQDDERYEHVSDVRAQLKFFEQLDQIEKQRKDEQEREILMRAAKASIWGVLPTRDKSVTLDVERADV